VKDTVLVTGCAGFIGSRVAELLLEQGQRVVGVDNLNEAYDTRLKEWRLGRLMEHTGFTFQNADITDAAAMAKLFQEQRRDRRNSPFGVVVNLAARAGVRQSLFDPKGYFDTNVCGALVLLELCKSHGVKKYVLASSSSVYGARNGKAAQAFHEDDRTDTPLSPYASSKKSAETLCYAYHHLYGLDISVLRFFTVYGPAGRPDMSLFRFVKWIHEGEPVRVFGDGTQSRDFTYVEDIARGVVAAMRPLSFEIINLGSDAPVVLKDAIDTVSKAVGKKAVVLYEPPQEADVPATWADIGKARRLLGWEPKTRFQDGVAHAVRWYRDNRNWARTISTG
jgi:nucleoside-diphosphate-sugar epimerase